MPSKKYVLVNKTQILGEFLLHHGNINDHPNNSCLRAAFEIVDHENDSSSYLPGYQTFSGKFYPCPIASLYIQINILESLIENEEKVIKASLVIFSKDFKNQKLINIFLKSPIYGLGTVSIMSVNKIVNALNFYVEDGNSIEFLNENVLNDTNGLDGLDSHMILGYINNLEFKFYENCLVRVGKDNYFWSEIEIFNLPTNLYIIELFVRILSHCSEQVFYNESKGHIFFKYDGQYSYSPSHGRNEIEVNGNVVESVKDTLKINIFEYFESGVEINCRLKTLT